MVHPSCIQYQKKIQNSKDAFLKANLNQNGLKKLKISDYTFSFVDPEDRETKKEVVKFICQNEYLEKMNMRTTHMFIARLDKHIAGALTLSTPITFSSILGRKYRDQEKLISRGATSAIAIKNVGSALNAFALNWMIQNTEFRIFSAYSDPEAFELGTLYKSLNFIYLGQNYGARLLLKDPQRPERGWFSDREARKLSSYKRVAKRLRIEWQREWNTKWKIHWEKLPQGMEEILRRGVKDYIASCEQRKPKAKHKWLYLKGRDKRETKELQNAFKKNNPKLIHGDEILGLPYPQESSRGL